MGQYRMGPPEDIILALQQRLGLTYFVETGTYRGDTAAWASAHFCQVVTIELSPAFHAAARARFRTLPHVRVLGGDSSVELREVMAGLSEPAIFWLDAHWSGMDTAGSDAECPVLAEIALINSSPHAHVVFVDDARLFCAPPPRPHRTEQWPDLASMIAVLSNDSRRHVVLVEDVFIAVPAADRQSLVAQLQDRATCGAVQSGTPLMTWLKKLIP